MRQAVLPINLDPRPAQSGTHGRFSCSISEGHIVPGEGTGVEPAPQSPRNSCRPWSQNDDGSPVNCNANEIWRTQSATSLGKCTSHSEQGHVTMYVTQPITQTSPSNSPDSFCQYCANVFIKNLSPIQKFIYFAIFHGSRTISFYTFFKRTLMLPGWGGRVFAPWGFEHSQEGSWGMRALGYRQSSP